MLVPEPGIVKSPLRFVSLAGFRQLGRTSAAGSLSFETDSLVAEANQELARLFVEDLLVVLGEVVPDRRWSSTRALRREVDQPHKFRCRRSLV